MGGGLLTAVEEGLSPVLICSGSNEAEILVVQIVVGKYKIRVINGYGPQENENKEKVYLFWQQFEKEIINAKIENCLILAELDANAKLGTEFLKNDPNPISDNGKILLDIIERQQLVCLNKHKWCEGSITRHRNTINGAEKSIIDFVIVCDQLLPYFQRMVIDEKRENILTKFSSLKGTRVKSESDHNPIFAQFNLTFQRKQVFKRREIFDFKNTVSQQKFHDITDNCEKLRTCFRYSHSPKMAANNFLKTLNQTFHRAFTKIRIKPQKSLLHSRKNCKNLREKTDLEKIIKNSESKETIEAARHKLEEVELRIYKEISEKNMKLVTEHMAKLDSFDGKFNQLGMWKIKSKLFPRPKDPPNC